jgi:hypothetical protein
VAPEDLPEELRRRESRLARIEAAMAELEREAAIGRAEQLLENAEGQWKKAEDPSVSEPERTRAATRAAKSEALAAELDPPNDDGDPPSATVADDLPKHRVPSDPDGVPDPHAQRNFTDADSRIMVAGGTYVQAYNAQVSVDDTAQVIVALAVTNQPPDVEHFVPMLDRIEGGLGRLPQRVSGDSGYYSNANVQHWSLPSKQRRVCAASGAFQLGPVWGSTDRAPGRSGSRWRLRWSPAAMADPTPD